jgi:hypothetical protein
MKIFSSGMLIRVVLYELTEVLEVKSAITLKS